MTNTTNARRLGGSANGAPSADDTSSHEDPDEVLYSGSDDEDYACTSQRLMRYETCAIDFLAGRPTHLQSARLRGRFDRVSGWTNPWGSRRYTTVLEVSSGGLQTKAVPWHEASSPTKVGAAALVGHGYSLSPRKGAAPTTYLPSPESPGPVTPGPLDEAVAARVTEWVGKVPAPPADHFWRSDDSLADAAGKGQKKRPADAAWLKRSMPKRRKTTTTRGDVDSPSTAAAARSSRVRTLGPATPIKVVEDEDELAMPMQTQTPPSDRSRASRLLERSGQKSTRSELAGGSALQARRVDDIPSRLSAWRRREADWNATAARTGSGILISQSQSALSAATKGRARPDRRVQSQQTWTSLPFTRESSEDPLSSHVASSYIPQHKTTLSRVPKRQPSQVLRRQREVSLDLDDLANNYDQPLSKNVGANETANNESLSPELGSFAHESETTETVPTIEKVSLLDAELGCQPHVAPAEASVPHENSTEPFRSTDPFDDLQGNIGRTLNAEPKVQGSTTTSSDMDHEISVSSVNEDVGMAVDDLPDRKQSATPTSVPESEHHVLAGPLVEPTLSPRRVSQREYCSPTPYSTVIVKAEASPTLRRLSPRAVGLRTPLQERDNNALVSPAELLDQTCSPLEKTLSGALEARRLSGVAAVALDVLASSQSPQATRGHADAAPATLDGSGPSDNEADWGASTSTLEGILEADGGPVGEPAQPDAKTLSKDDTIQTCWLRSPPPAAMSPKDTSAAAPGVPAPTAMPSLATDSLSPPTTPRLGPLPTIRTTTPPVSSPIAALSPLETEPRASSFDAVPRASSPSPSGLSTSRNAFNPWAMVSSPTAHAAPVEGPSRPAMQSVDAVAGESGATGRVTSAASALAAATRTSIPHTAAGKNKPPKLRGILRPVRKRRVVTAAPAGEEGAKRRRVSFATTPLTEAELLEQAVEEGGVAAASQAPKKPPYGRRFCHPTSPLELQQAARRRQRSTRAASPPPSATAEVRGAVEPFSRRSDPFAAHFAAVAGKKAAADAAKKDASNASAASSNDNNIAHSAGVDGHKANATTAGHDDEAEARLRTRFAAALSPAPDAVVEAAAAEDAAMADAQPVTDRKSGLYNFAEDDTSNYSNDGDDRPMDDAEFVLNNIDDFLNGWNEVGAGMGKGKEGKKRQQLGHGASWASDKAAGW